MPRGKNFSEEIREHARQLRRTGCSLGEISQKLGIPKNTILLWIQGIELTAEQRDRLARNKVEQLGRAGGARALAAEAHRRAKQKRIELEQEKARALLDSLEQPHHAKHIAAAMLFLGEGSKKSDTLEFPNSNPQIIRYWLHLLRSSFSIDEAKFRLRLMIRADQDPDAIHDYWVNLTGISNCQPVYVDPRTVGKSATYEGYKGVCMVYYHDVSLKRYLEALAFGMVERAVGREAA